MKNLIFDIIARDKASKTVEGVGKAVDEQTAAWDNLKGKMAVAGAAAVAAGGAFMVSSVSAASDLQQSMGGVDAVFKNSADQVHAWAASAATDLGLSKNQYNEFATIVGSQLKNMGIPMSDVTGLTNDLIGKGADLAATFGGSTSDAVSALSAALRGETDPIERYGISIKQADVNAKMAAMGLTGLTGEAEKNARTQALLALVNEQSADAQGAFARESDTLAGAQARLGAKFENIKATVGTALLPVLTDVTTWVSDHMGPAFETVSSALGDFGGWVVKNKDWLAPLAVAVGTIVVAVKGYSLAMAAWKAAQGAAIAVQLAWNASLLANPIGLIVTAIAALVAGLVYFFTQTETGKQVWQSFTDFLGSSWEWIQSAFETGVEAVTGFLQDCWSFIQTVWSYTPLGLITSNWSSIMSFFGSIPGRVRDFAQSAVDFIKRIWSYTPLGLITSNWSSIMSFFGSIPGKVSGFFSDIGSKISAPFKTGFNQVASAWNNTVGRLSWTVPSWVPAIGGRTISAPKIPMMADGGTVLRAGLAVVGEAGPELLALPVGAQVKPLDNRDKQAGNGMYRSGVQIGQLNAVGVTAGDIWDEVEWRARLR